MVSDPGATAARQAEGALQLGAAAEDRPPGLDRQAECPGHEAARAPDHQRRLAHGPIERADDRVVGPGVDRAVVNEEDVGDRPEPLERVVVVEGDRLVGEIARGHDQRQRRRAGEQMVQR